MHLAGEQKRAVVTSIACGLVLAASKGSLATDRFFPDQVRYSPKRTVRLEARSPDNEGVDPEKPWDMKPFQDDFTYTLYAAETNEVVWQRPQGSKEGSPTQVFADDTRWAVVRTGWEQLLAIDPKGKTTLKLDILKKALTDSERREYTSWTTAGAMWGGLSFWYFAQLRDKPHFCIRTGWGRRILIDLGAGQLNLADDHGRSVLQTRERDFAMAVLKEAVSYPEIDEEERVSFEAVETAVSMAPRSRGRRYQRPCARNRARYSQRPDRFGIR